MMVFFYFIWTTNPSPIWFPICGYTKAVVFLDFPRLKVWKGCQYDTNNPTAVPIPAPVNTSEAKCLLFYEYKDSNLWYASSGYLFATATGVLRIANNKHYASDVLTGAGIGTAVGLLVSYWHPFQSFNLGKSKKTTALVYPQIGNQIGLGLVVQMK